MEDKQILYLSFHNSLKKVYGENKFVTKKAICIKLGRQFLVPKRLREEVLKELEKRELIKNEGGGYFRVLCGKVDLEKEKISNF